MYSGQQHTVLHLEPENLLSLKEIQSGLPTGGLWNCELCWKSTSACQAEFIEGSRAEQSRVYCFYNDNRCEKISENKKMVCEL